ncbi:MULTISPECIES: FliG C-terminal domain-containing protein [Pseudomonas]|uniref:Flagellar motor switch protein FliG n=2 Tax=Pseudomonas nitroreducens/multiresinivorans group TaxID=627141 RepID=A0A6G6IRY6_PSENT|nr:MULTISPECIES: FliG C-terminal domain-containing protein [Pseudomonas]MBG6287561.1 flagellar motor switch protein FliG [Pseudomonas nitroreducens]MCE4068073.1 flagellar motor switch protein FliG [Pseudomonas nitritireducens]MCE4077262.1 flagellar motor switch protein FliG [Pseudomonas nitroreducens]MCJ1878920.1 flagellar motor switch protein FliG [Pseudomonas nitroreducens]MCJ1896266.1 flagellar motor switch protein FliG [Pseudomonas nitroreducens]
MTDTSLPEEPKKRGPQMRAVSSLEQAAILMLSMGDEASAGILRNFSREEIVSISQAMARLSNVKQNTVSDVIGRFFDDYKLQSSIKGASRSYLAGMLGKALGSDITRNLLDSIYGEEIRAKMARMEWIDPKQFAALIAKEHAQMQAVFLAFLPPGMATDVLEAMPAERQDELLFRIANLSEVNSDVIAELEQLIDRSLRVLSTQGSQVRGVKQAADIMNRFKGDRNQMFELLRAHNDSLVGRIEDEMYDFFILSRQNQEVLQTLLEVIPLDEWVVALKGAEPELVRAIQGAMPKRQMQQMESINRRQGPVPLSRVEQVRKEIMGVVRDLAAEGDLQVQLFREQTVE